MDRVTLAEACRMLGISRHTLRKWVTRLGITVELHARDWRYRTMAREAVEQIRAARSEMPWAAQTATEATLLGGGVRRIEAAQSASDGLYSWYRWAVEHNISPSTVQHVVTDRERRGKLQCAAVPLVDGRLDLAGQAALYARFVGHPRFTRCSRCPHAQPHPDEAAQNDHGAGS